MAQNRQKSYADNHRRDLKFQQGDWVYLKISPMKGIKRFSIHGKLSPRYIGPYQVTHKVGKVTYQLELPQYLQGVHNTFHVSMLRSDCDSQQIKSTYHYYN